MGGFLGMRGTGDWATDERPMNWRQGILRLYPNGSAPLTAILSKMGEEKVDDAQYHWWTKLLPTQGGSFTAGVIYSDSGLSSAYASGASAGDVLYLKIPATATSTLAGIDEFRVGHQITFRDESDATNIHNAKVISVNPNGSSSYISFKMLEDDDNGDGTTLANADYVQITGNINSEGAPMPDGIAYNPTKYYNYTQIFRTPLSITRTAMETKLRTEQSYKEMKREALELHSIEMEKAYLWGIRTENTGTNGKYERTTCGLVPFIRDYASDNIFDYISDSDFSGQTWIQGGEDWFDSKLEQLFRYGSQEKLAFCGSGALLGIQKLAKTYGQIQLTVQSTSYGIKVLEWVTPFGVLYLKTHPLFSYSPVDRYNMIVFEPKLLKYKYITDTKFKPDTSSGAASYDGKNEEYLTECGLEFHHPLCCAFLTNLNKTNVA
jgi:hypothetical protein